MLDIEFNIKLTILLNGGELQEWPDGNKYWYLNGKWHREDGPAVEFSNGDKWWYKNGNLHREDGPAIEVSGYKSWYLNDKYIPCTTQKQFEQYMRLKAFW